MTRVLAAPLALLAALALLLAAPSSASAHEPVTTLVIVDRDGSSAELSVTAPLDRYDLAYDTQLAGDGAPSQPETDELESRLVSAVTVATEGSAWPVTVVDLDYAEIDGVQVVQARLSATGPTQGAAAEAADTAALELGWTFIIDDLVTHRVYVGSATEADELLAADQLTPADVLGVLGGSRTTLTIEIGESSSAATLFRIGFDHFREGPDHLWFLALLALAAARRREGMKPTALRLLGVTVAFTVGHSLSLAAATMGWVSLPAAFVETGIAVTIVAAAAYALRPWMGVGTEVGITGAFGLIHGLGFAGTLADLGATGTDAVVPLLGFNLGLETAQILGLLIVLPPLLVLSRSLPATLAVAGVGAAVALGWALDRSVGLTLPIDPFIDLIASSPERLALTLLIGAGVLLGIQRLKNPTQDDRKDPIHVP